jgi:hypothetical protein
MSTRKGREKVGPAVVSPVEGGWVKRDAASGRFVEVHGSSGTEKPRPKSEDAVRTASEKRHEALKRLADR